MNQHTRIKPVSTVPFDLEPDICHLAREARAAQIMADELITQLKFFGTVDVTGDQIQILTAEAREMLQDFSGRVARCANDLRTKFYGGMR